MTDASTRERVLIVSPHPLFRDGIIGLLGEEAEVIGAVTSWEDAKALDPRPRPHVVVVDHDDADLKEADLAPLLWPDAQDLRVIYVTLAGDKMTVHDRRQVVGAGEADLLRALKGDRWDSSTDRQDVTRPETPVVPDSGPGPGGQEPQGRTNHMDRSQNRRHLIIVAILVAISTVIVAVFLSSVQLFQPPASTQAGPIDALFSAQLIIIAFLFSLIVIFMLYSVFVFRRRAGEDGDGVHFHGNTRLEITWTIIPLITVLVLGFFGARGLAEVTAVGPDPLEVEVIAQQFAFRFNYPEQDIKNSTELVLPVNKPVLLHITAIDVIHDFWVPEFRVKQDAVPGLVRDLSITPNEIGEYQVRCDELCGILHHDMRSPVRVVSQDDFNSWADQKIAEAQAGPELSELATQGEALAASTGCIACHNVSGEPGGIGPTWQGLFGSQVELADGTLVTADEDYIHSSIVNPNDQIHAGYPPGVMPQTYDQQLSDEEITAIVEYIKALGGQ